MRVLSRFVLLGSVVILLAPRPYADAERTSLDVSAPLVSRSRAVWARSRASGFSDAAAFSWHDGESRKTELSFAGEERWGKKEWLLFTGVVVVVAVAVAVVANNSGGGGGGGSGGGGY